MNLGDTTARLDKVVARRIDDLSDIRRRGFRSEGNRFFPPERGRKGATACPTQRTDVDTSRSWLVTNVDVGLAARNARCPRYEERGQGNGKQRRRQT